MAVYIENIKTKQIGEFSQVAGSKFNIFQSTTFLFINNNQLEKNNK